MDENIKLFDTISPLDYRYYGRDKAQRERIGKFLSEEAFIQYQAKVELALIQVLVKKGIAPKQAIQETKQAIEKIKAEEVYQEEDRIKHNIRALVNQIRNNVSDKTKPYIHFTTTSFDIFDTANALRFKEFAEQILIPDLIKLVKTLADIALREKNTLQIGRTHGQHAEPITFGFTISSYVSRLGSRTRKLIETKDNLRGKISGAVGAYNASSLFFNDPEQFEKAILSELNLKPSPQSSQIAEPEYITDYMHVLTSIFGILANLADDMRALQRSEINEIAEQFEQKQVGSSTMPHKRNPINFENIKSLYKEFMPRMITVYLDQISEHQRDLTNSASQRFLPEIAAALDLAITRMTKTMSRIVVDKYELNNNFKRNKDLISAEPAYIVLAAHNHPDAHEAVRDLTVKSQQQNIPFQTLFMQDKTIEQYLKKFTEKQLRIIENPELYTGIASKKVEKICNFYNTLFKKF